MIEDAEHVPAYRTIRMSPPDAPVAALADLEAWQARNPYPDLRGADGPAFGIARESEEGGWRLEPHCGNSDPQDARDSMAGLFRRRAHEAEQAGDEERRQAFLAAADRLDWEEIDELTVAGTRYRVVRCERFIRTGPDGPEPPRTTDPDPSPAGLSYQEPDPADGFVLDPISVTGLSEGILKLELLGLVHPVGPIEQGIKEDAVRAVQTHPGGVLLPPVFMVAERTAFGWQPSLPALATSPQDARDSISFGLRVVDPVRRRLDPAQRAEYARAAQWLDDNRANDLDVAGRHLRVVRVERLIRIGPDGPEGPRSSDRSLQPPFKVHDQQLRAAGSIPEDEDENAPIVLGPDAEEMHQLMIKEQERRAAVAAKEQRRKKKQPPKRGGRK
ncbi:DUF5954 family protein [Kitasatospora sp. NBC_01266]|uniref:DUF5954 family protein n=1 Tax=Kitasatospora sp. NBC_01266 TaxID=2903572 RepID=UPI002E32620A|nr:DUF5954 family protein [Kitasatospora sp. NBC_01266]